MNSELTKTLCEKFPILYRGRHQSIKQNLMSFGFEHGDGWYEIIYKLSEKLEALAVQIQKEELNRSCANCGCGKEDHLGSGTAEPSKCMLVKKYPKKNKYKTFVAKKIWQRPFVWFKYQLYKVGRWYDKTFDYKLWACWCEKYEATLPIVVQVKEKYGTLRYYMHYSTEEMEDLIDEAERQSSKTCEQCGQPGVLRGKGWYFTACDTHAYDSSGNYSEPTGSDDEC